MSFTSADRSELKNSLQKELGNILSYWETFAPDNENGGFYGELTNGNKVVPNSVKGSILNARILWSFSAAYNQTKTAKYLSIAKRALDYIRDHFVDNEFGGVYWSVTAKGEPADTKKQIYALSFTIYGLAEYYKATADEGALALAQKLYYDIEQHSFDKERGGYLEALTRDWQLIDDLRLSDKDANEKKTMNTHLHILEAYTTLYTVWPDAGLATQIKGLLLDFTGHIIDSNTNHLILFFDENWEVKSDTVSYGHDIEASWLLLEAAEALHDEELINTIKQLAVKIATASAEGLNADGSMNYEYEPSSQHLITERHWWVQAEAMVGFYNAWQLSNDDAFLNNVLKGWQYIQQNIIDHKKGEWFWGVNADGTLMPGYGKAGFWKCPYHNSRSCMQLIERL
jgi:mannobiose 2-epimerase